MLLDVGRRGFCGRRDVSGDSVIGGGGLAGSDAGAPHLAMLLSAEPRGVDLAVLI